MLSALDLVSEILSMTLFRKIRITVMIPDPSYLLAGGELRDNGKMPPFPILGSENRVGWV